MKERKRERGRKKERKRERARKKERNKTYRRADDSMSSVAITGKVEEEEEEGEKG